MPTLSTFYGIKICMYNESGERHNTPHIHCIYAEHEVVVDFDGTIMEGSLPSPQTKLVQAWIVLHKNELEQNWQLLSNGEKHFSIKPLI